MNNSWLPIAVAPNHPPCIIPWYFGGATLDTNEIPSGEIYNSATVNTKYVAINNHGVTLIGDVPASTISLCKGKCEK